MTFIVEHKSYINVFSSFFEVKMGPIMTSPRPPNAFLMIFLGPQGRGNVESHVAVEKFCAYRTVRIMTVSKSSKGRCPQLVGTTQVLIGKSKRGFS